MNKKSFLVIGLLFSIGSILADSHPSEPVSSSVETAAKADFYDEALQKFSTAAAESILSGEDMSGIFNSIPEQFKNDKDKIFTYIIGAMDTAQETEDKDSFANVVAKRTLLEYQHDDLLSKGVSKKYEQVLEFGDRNQETLKNAGMVIGLVALGYVLGSSNSTPASTALENAEAVRDLLVEPGGVRESIINACKTQGT